MGSLAADEQDGLMPLRAIPADGVEAEYAWLQWRWPGGFRVHEQQFLVGAGVKLDVLRVMDDLGAIHTVFFDLGRKGE